MQMWLVPYKNKNKSKQVQAYVKQVTNQTMFGQQKGVSIINTPKLGNRLISMVFLLTIGF